MTVEYEEYRDFGTAGSWAILIGLCIVTLIIGFVCYAFIRDLPRQWDFGALPQTPAESIYSTAPPPPVASPPPQIAPLPEAQPTPTPQVGGTP